MISAVNVLDVVDQEEEPLRGAKLKAWRKFYYLGVIVLGMHQKRWACHGLHCTLQQRKD